MYKLTLFLLTVSFTIPSRNAIQLLVLDVLKIPRFREPARCKRRRTTDAVAAPVAVALRYLELRRSTTAIDLGWFYGQNGFVRSYRLLLHRRAVI